MVPQQYRLDHVVARLIQRLEGARRSYAGNPARAEMAFRQIAQEHLETISKDLVGVTASAFEPMAPEDQERFLTREVLQTFLPRYTRMANEMTEQEYQRFGFGVAASPIARLLTLGLCLVVFFYLVRLAMWPFALLCGSFPFWPDISAWLYRQQYAKKLEDVLTDMARIQDDPASSAADG